MRTLLVILCMILTVVNTLIVLRVTGFIGPDKPAPERPKPVIRAEAPRA